MLDAASGSAEMDERKSTSSKVEEKGSPAVNQEVPPSETAALEKGGGGDGNPEGTHDDRDPPIDPEPDALAVASLPLGLVPSTQGPRETYPEGGLRAWLVVLGSWLILFSSLGIINILATFQAYISSHQLAGQDEGTTGWIFSVYTFLCFFLGVYIGPIFDRYGPRWLILSGTICLAVGLMLVSISTQYWHFLLTLGVLCGTGTSLLFTPSIAAVGHYFFERRGLATGIASTAGSLGGVVFPLMLQSLFVKVGWGWAIRILAFICITLAIAGNFLIRSRLPPAAGESPHPNFRIFKNTPFLLTTVAVFFVEFALFIPLTYISSYAISKGFTEDFALRLPTILNTGSFVGRILPGYYADKIGPFNANMISVILSIIACLCVWLPVGQTTAGVVIFSLMFGFCSGSNISLIPVSIGRLCKTQNYGRYYATCYTFVSIACLVGIPIAGRILTANGGDYMGLIIFTGAVYFVSLVAFVAAKVSVVGWKMLAPF